MDICRLVYAYFTVIIRWLVHENPLDMLAVSCFDRSASTNLLRASLKPKLLHQPALSQGLPRPVRKGGSESRPGEHLEDVVGWSMVGIKFPLTIARDLRLLAPFLMPFLEAQSLRVSPIDRKEMIFLRRVAQAKFDCSSLTAHTHHMSRDSGADIQVRLIDLDANADAPCRPCRGTTLLAYPVIMLLLHPQLFSSFFAFGKADNRDKKTKEEAGVRVNDGLGHSMAPDGGFSHVLAEDCCVLSPLRHQIQFISLIGRGKQADWFFVEVARLHSLS